ncbi:MAG: proteasome subunit alpha, partial [Thermoplasmata archaeon]|nr:proteasome subunit alpha [Thermoplasmata archaeon]
DPSGAMMEYKATAEGEGRDAAISYFEENYRENMSMKEAIEMGKEAIKIAKKSEDVEMEIAIIDKRGFRIKKF